MRTMIRKILFYYALAVSLLALFLWVGWRCDRAERRRLTANQRALIERLDTARCALDGHRASVEVLRLRCREYEELRRRDAEQLRALGIRLRRAEAASVQVTATRLDAAMPLRDTVVVRGDTVALVDTVRRFRWHDAWMQIEGTIRRDTVVCRVQSCDTLHQVVHCVPRRFLFFRWGTKAIRQEIRSSNPHTQLVYTDYVVIER